jgi:hypothetical protein
MARSRLIIDRPRLTAILDKYHAELMAIPRGQFIAMTVPRDRVLALTEHILASMSAYEPRLDQVFLPAYASELRNELGRLPERAQAFYAADLLAEEAYTPAEEQERRQVFERVAEHDRTLLKWARPLFGDHPGRAQILDDIQRGTGHQDSAEDVVRLVALFRGNWAEAEGQTPITGEHLDAAEADATRMLEFLSGKNAAEARDLVRRAFTAWAWDYREIMALGRYLARDEPDVAIRFPGIHAERTGVRRGKNEPGGDTAAGNDEPGGDGSTAGNGEPGGNGSTAGDSSGNAGSES